MVRHIMQSGLGMRLAMLIAQRIAWEIKIEK